MRAFRRLLVATLVAAAVFVAPILEASAALQFSTTLRNAMLDQMTSTIGASGLLRLYTGTEPATCATALSGNTLLVELTFNATFAPAASSGVLTLNAITNGTAVATGTAVFFRSVKSDGTTCVFQGTVGTSGADLNLNTTSIVSGGPVSVTSWTITAPGA